MASEGKSNETIEGKSEDEDFFGENFIPSISDRVQVGYASMDRACQTDVTQIVDLKKMASVLGVVVKDLFLLKRGLYFSKLTLQSEYEGRLEEVALELYDRVNHRINEIEDIHQERIHVIRRSYKTQLANALTKLSRDYHMFYGNKDAMAEATNKKKLEELKKHQESMRKNELAQKEMYEMLRIQMEDNKEKEPEIPSRKSSVVSLTPFTEEIEELKKSIKDFEKRVDYLEECLEDTSVDNQKLNAQLVDKNNKLRLEQRKVSGLTENVEALKEEAEKERDAANQRLEDQRASLRKEMHSKIDALRSEHQAEMDKRLSDARKGQNNLLRQQKLAEAARLKELMEKKEEEEEKVVVEVPQDTDFSRLKLIEKKQRVEISRLNKRIEQLTKLSELKVKVLNEHIHSLKDEMFLRTTLQRQTTKMKQTTVTYVRSGSDMIPLGFQPCNEKLTRKHQLPSIIGAPSED